MKKYLYETHLHTMPVSRCASATVRESLECYKALGYDGIFITNHFIDGNISCVRDLPYAERLNYYFSDYEEGLRLSDEIGIKVFLGVELSYKGTDFLVYGLDKEWYLAHPEIMEMKKSKELPFLMESGALVVHAHPYREDSYIDHIRLFPRCVQGVETINAGRTDFVNEMADKYAEAYSLVKTAGTDNHHSHKKIKRVAGMEFFAPIENERDFCERVLAGEGQLFIIPLERSDNNE